MKSNVLIFIINMRLLSGLGHNWIPQKVKKTRFLNKYLLDIFHKFVQDLCHESKCLWFIRWVKKIGDPNYEFGAVKVQKKNVVERVQTHNLHGD